MSAKLLTTTDIAELLGVCRQHVTNRVTKRPDFPAPVVNLSQRTNAGRPMKWRSTSEAGGDLSRCLPVVRIQELAQIPMPADPRQRHHIHLAGHAQPYFPSRFTIAMQRSTAANLSGVPRTRSR